MNDLRGPAKIHGPLNRRVLLGTLNLSDALLGTLNLSDAICQTPHLAFVTFSFFDSFRAPHVDCLFPLFTLSPKNRTVNITFGLGFDSFRQPDDTALFDATVVGENGLLALLEERLGLAPPPEHSFERIGPLTDAIAACGADSYFARSFEVDSIGVAREAMRWVDELLLAGEGPVPELSADAFPRLHALCQIAHWPGACHGHGGRIRRILPLLEELGSPREIGVGELCHVPTLEVLPRGWALLLQALGATTVDEPELLADPGTSLARVAAFLSDPSTAPPVELPDDGSLRIVTATSESALADHLATSLAARGHAEGLAILSAGDELVLDAAFLGRDLPPLGNARGGSLAAPGQLLGLALDNLWEPFDPSAFLAFLHHPSCPVQWHLRQKLIEHLERTPGRPADDFEHVLEKTLKWIRSGSTEDKDAAAGRAGKDLARWVRHPRWSPEAGVSPEAVTALADRVASALPEREVSARNLARAFARLLTSRGEASLSPGTLSRLLAETVDAYAGSPPLQAALGCPAALGLPEFAIEPIDELVWWGFVDDDPAARPWWTENERLALEAGGFLLRERIPRFAALVRPFRAAKKALTLYVPKARLGEATRPQPILDRLVAAQIRLPLIDLDALVARSEPAAGLVAASLSPLPPRRRWWELPGTDLFTPRKVESYTSLDKLLSAPQDWVLGQVADLRREKTLQGIPLTLPASVEGTLIHRAAERFFETWNPQDAAGVDQDKVAAWVADHWPALLSEQAALLLHEGEQLHSAHLRRITTDVLFRLCGMLQHFGATEVACEVAFYGEQTVSCRDVQIGGYVDLLARRADGSITVIDLKLGGMTRRKEELKAGRQLQIAIYTKLAARGGAIAQVPSGYFILNSGRLLCLAADAPHFGTSYVEKQKPHQTRGDLEAVWRDFEILFDWRRAQLSGGRIELPVVGTEVDLEPPVDGWFPRKPEDNPYSDFRNLHGWLPTQ